MASLIPVQAGGNINPSRFVTIDVTDNHTVVESNSGDTKIFGISAEHTRDTPDSGGSAYHAIAGDQARIHVMGDDPLLELGVGGCTAGDFLKPDNDGKGVTAASGATAGALAMESGSAGEKVKVFVLPPGLKL